MTERTIGFYTRVAGFGVFDLVAGTAIGYLVGGLFKKPAEQLNLSEIDLREWLGLGLELLFQGLLTLFIGVELRSIFTGSEDPTGGILFILSVFRQPSFWDKVDILALATYNLIMGDIYPSLFNPGN